MNQQEGLARWARPAVSHFTIPEFLDARPSAMSIGAAAPVGDAVDPADGVRPEALHGARVRFRIQRAEVIFLLIRRQFQHIVVGSDGGREKGGQKNDEDEN